MSTKKPMTPTSFPYLRADYWSVEIERLRRERDALLREHEAWARVSFAAWRAHDEANRVLAEGKGGGDDADA